jgi:Domain of unknown function (DUF1833)
VSRAVSTSALHSLHVQDTQEAFLILLTLSHDSLETPIRVTSDAVQTESNGEVFVPYPFTLSLPDDDESRSPRARLVIDNIDRQIVGAVRSLATPPAVLIEIVRAAAPDTVEARFADFRLVNVTYDAQAVEADLSVEDFTTEPFPAQVFSPGLFPGIF